MVLGNITGMSEHINLCVSGFVLSKRKSLLQVDTQEIMINDMNEAGPVLQIYCVEEMMVIDSTECVKKLLAKCAHLKC